MSEKAHAILSASGSKRWLTCTPSAKLELDFEEEKSVYAEEGTLAHEDRRANAFTTFEAYN